MQKFKHSILPVINRVDAVLIRTFKAINAHKALADLFQTIGRVVYRNGIRIYYAYDNEVYLHEVGNKTIKVDTIPNWRASYEKLKRPVFGVHLKKYQPKKDDCIVEIGTGNGSDALILSNMIINGKFYAIEAHPKTYMCAKILFENNGVKNVDLHNIAIVDKSKKVKMTNKISHQSNYVGDGEIEIKALSFDDFVRENKIKKINFLKVNIEGAELELIKGMEGSLGIIENIAISCHDFIYPEKEIKNKVITFFKENGFTIHQIEKTGHSVKDNWVYGTRKA